MEERVACELQAVPVSNITYFPPQSVFGIYSGTYRAGLSFCIDHHLKYLQGMLEK